MDRSTTSLTRRSQDDVRAFLARHPWPAELLAEGQPMHWLWRFELGLPVESVWPFLIDTSRFNRMIGVTKMHFEERDGALRGSTANLGISQEWVEVPWDWAWGKSLVSVRRYDRGFGRIARAVYELTPAGEGACELLVYFGWIPRGWLSSVILRAGMPWLESGYRKGIGEIERLVKAEGPGARLAPVAAPPLPAERRYRLASLGGRLREEPIDRAAVDGLIAHVEQGDEMDLFRIQVPKLARDIGLDEDALLLACLHATRVGLLELSWDVLCPHCRGVRRRVEHLGQLATHERCEACAIDFETADEESIEVTFRVHPSIREVPPVFFCSAEPAKKAHIRLQQGLAPGESRRIEARIGAGDYRARLRGERRTGRLSVRQGGLTDARWEASDPTPQLALAAEHELELINDTDAPVTFVIEDPAWTDRALRPARLFSLQSFRDLFSEEYLGAEVQISVGRQTILFTDVVGSTRFYKDRGDPAAFIEVKRHFARIYDVVARHQGAVIKTIGDAVMAAFVDSADALRAAGAIQRAFPAGSIIRVRASLHAGPCIAVNLNSGVDYFGSTVNLAAKLQASADAGEVAFSRAVHDAPGAREALRELGARVTERAQEVAALGETVDVLHWIVSTEGGDEGRA